MARDPAVKRQHQREATRRRLVAAALQLFSRRGYERTTVDAIARAAGYSKGAFYVHFSRKEDLFLELVREGVAAEGGGQDGAAAASARRPEEVLEQLASYLEERPYRRPLLAEFAAHAWRNERICRGLSEVWGRWETELRESFRRTGEGPLAGQGGALAARVLVASAQGLALRPPPDDERAGAGAQEVLATTLAGLSGRPVRWPERREPHVAA